MRRVRRQIGISGQVQEEWRRRTVARTDCIFFIRQETLQGRQEQTRRLHAAQRCHETPVSAMEIGNEQGDRQSH